MFPITGELREFTLFLEWILLFFYTEVGIIYLSKSIGKRKGIRSAQDRAYAFLFFTYTFMWLWRILADYYVLEQEIRDLLIFISIFSQLISIFIFIFLIEVIKNFYRRFLFSLITLSVIITLFFLSFLNLAFVLRISFFIWFIYIVSSIYYIIKLRKINEYKKKIKIFVIHFTLGFSLLLIGLLMTSSRAYELFGIEMRILGDFLQLFAIFVIHLFLSSLPAFTEFEWFDKIEQIIIMNKSGASLYLKDFSGEFDETSASIVSGHIYAIQVILQGITHKKDITVINREENTVIIYPGEYINGIIICKENLISIQRLIARFVYKIEVVYSNVLKSWKGNLEIFKPIEQIYQDVFASKK